MHSGSKVLGEDSHREEAPFDPRSRLRAIGQRNMLAQVPRAWQVGREEAPSEHVLLVLRLLTLLKGAEFPALVKLETIISFS